MGSFAVSTDRDTLRDIPASLDVRLGTLERMVAEMHRTVTDSHEILRDLHSRLVVLEQAAE